MLCTRPIFQLSERHSTHHFFAHPLAARFSRHIIYMNFLTRMLLLASAHALSTHAPQAPHIDQDALFDREMSLEGVQPMNGRAPMQLWLRGGSEGRTVLDAVRARTVEEADALGAVALAIAAARLHDYDQSSSTIQRLRGGARGRAAPAPRRPLWRRVAERLGSSRDAGVDSYVLDPITLVLVPEGDLDSDPALHLCGGRMEPEPKTSV